MFFEGTYYKHQCRGNTLCIIKGSADDGKFLQAIVNGKVYHYDDFSNCVFGDSGITLNLANLKGQIQYTNQTPLKSDIMGFFRFFPMQCRHSVTSMRHDLEGYAEVSGERLDFGGGVGYIEGDKGRSFPKHYLWLQANDFEDKTSIMASVADVPFFGFHFLGCICAIVHQGTEYRLATYHGVKVDCLRADRLVLSQKNLRLEVDVCGQSFVPLKMPAKGKMTEKTFECNSSYARFKFFVNNDMIFDLETNHASYEYFFSNAQ